MPDSVVFWVPVAFLVALVALLCYAVAREARQRGYTSGYVEGLNHGVEQGKAVERARAENIAIATEADRKAAIRLNRSLGSRRGWAKRKGGA